MFHETLLELKGLSELIKGLESFKKSKIHVLDPTFMDTVEDVIKRTKATMESTRRIADDFYTIIMAQGTHHIMLSNTRASAPHRLPVEGPALPPDIYHLKLVALSSLFFCFLLCCSILIFSRA